MFMYCICVDQLQVTHKTIELWYLIYYVILYLTLFLWISYQKDGGNVVVQQVVTNLPLELELGNQGAVVPLYTAQYK